MKRLSIVSAGILLLCAGATREGIAGPFVDSVIVVSRVFSPGSTGTIDILLHNDSILSGIGLPLVIKSETGGAFGRIDSIQRLPSLNPFGMTSVLKVNGVTPDSVYMLSVDSGGGTVSPGSRRAGYRLYVTSNNNQGTFSLDSNRLSSANSLKFAHPPTQISIPVFIRGMEIIGGSLSLAATQVTLFKGKDSCVTVGGMLCDTTSQTLTLDSVRVQHSGDPDLLCITAIGATNLVGKTLSAFSCATDSGNGFLRVCQAPTASIGDTGTCTITFFGTLPSGAGAPARIVAFSAAISMASGSTGATVVPTLTQWGLAGFGVLLAGTLGYVYFRRRKFAMKGR